MLMFHCSILHLNVHLVLKVNSSPSAKNASIYNGFLGIIVIWFYWFDLSLNI
jgi:uncharacterized membrane protein